CSPALIQAGRDNQPQYLVWDLSRSWPPRLGRLPRGIRIQYGGFDVPKQGAAEFASLGVVPFFLRVWNRVCRRRDPRLAGLLIPKNADVANLNGMAAAVAQFDGRVSETIGVKRRGDGFDGYLHRI